MGADVKGGTNVGGIAGHNKLTGQLINCTYSGSLLGEHYVGGITGLNEGSVIRCQNDGSVNITEVKAAVALQEVDLSTIRSTENAPACTDIGGIAGASSGILQSCTNNGDVGYGHVGYNVGGIAGRQSGWLDSCVNNGTIRGRKDVGGICGQMEPRLTLLFDSDSLDDLWDELDTLQTLINKTIADAEGINDSISAHMTGITDSADEAKNAASDLSDALTGWTDENTPQAGEEGGASDAAGETPEGGDGADVPDQDAPDGDSTDWSQVLAAFDELRSAAAQIKNALGTLSSALAGVGDTTKDVVQEALNGIAAAAGSLGSAFQTMDRAAGHLSDALNDLDHAAPYNSTTHQSIVYRQEHPKKGRKFIEETGVKAILSKTLCKLPV